jgi:chromosome condensin MukBEF ATPase and DNA-binding subunit MukB
MKNWKNLFVKTPDDEDNEVQKPIQQKQTDSFSFPLNNSPVASSNTVVQNNAVAGIDEKVLNEVIAVYEKGIDSINMPGYDFYEFYKAISSISNPGEQAYQMAYQMAKSMDSTLTSQKLVKDADFYISKINEVHQQYDTQGQQKIIAIENKKKEEKNLLMSDIEKGTQQISQLRNQLQTLESEVNQKRTTLTTIDANYQPQEASIRQKLLANDTAKHISIMKLITVKENIQKNIK